MVKKCLKIFLIFCTLEPPSIQCQWCNTLVIGCCWLPYCSAIFVNASFWYDMLLTTAWWHYRWSIFKCRPINVYIYFTIWKSQTLNCILYRSVFFRVLLFCLNLLFTVCLRFLYVKEFAITLEKFYFLCIVS